MNSIDLNDKKNLNNNKMHTILNNFAHLQIIN